MWMLPVRPKRESVGMAPDNTGISFFHCNVSDQIAGGIITRCQVLPQKGCCASILILRSVGSSETKVDVAVPSELHFEKMKSVRASLLASYRSHDLDTGISFAVT
jgi:hypothetical protein